MAANRPPYHVWVDGYGDPNFAKWYWIGWFGMLAAFFLFCASMYFLNAARNSRMEARDRERIECEAAEWDAIKKRVKENDERERLTGKRD